MSHIMLTGYPIQKDLLLSTVLQLTAVSVTFLRWSYAPCPLEHDLPMKTANHRYAGIRSSCPPITTTNTWESASCIKVIKWFYYSSGSQQGLVLPPRGLLAMSRNIFDGHNMWGGGWVFLLSLSEKRPKMLLNKAQNSPSTAKNYCVQNVNSA